MFDYVSDRYAVCDYMPVCCIIRFACGDTTVEYALAETFEDHEYSYHADAAFLEIANDLECKYHALIAEIAFSVVFPETGKVYREVFTRDDNNEWDVSYC